MSMPVPRPKKAAVVFGKVKSHMRNISGLSGGSLKPISEEKQQINDDKQICVSSLPQEPSSDHTQATDPISLCSENIPGNGRGKKPPDPGSMEYSMAPRSDKLSVQTKGILSETKHASNVNRRKSLDTTPLHANKDKYNSSKQPGQRLTTISMPDEKYFAKPPRTPNHVQKPSHDSSIAASASHDSSIGASTITSAPDMSPAPTELTEATDDTDDWSESTNSHAEPPMSTIGRSNSDSRSRFSQGSTMSSRLRRKKISKVKESLLKDIHDMGVKLMREGKMDLALKKFEDIRGVLIEEYSEDHHRVGAALHNIGVVHVRSGKIDEACNTLREAVKIRKEMFGEYHPKVGDSLIELGIALLSRKDHDDSLAVFEEALQIRRRDAGKEFSLSGQELRDIQLSKILNNIGCVHFECQKNTKAIKSFEEALELQRNISKKGDDIHAPIILPMASTLSNIGYVHIANKNYDDAVESLEEADKLQQSILKPTNPVVLNTLDNMAYCSAMEGCYDTAMHIYEEILSHQEESISKNSLACAATRRNIACLHIMSCQFEKALDAMRVVESIQEQHLGPESRRLRNTVDLIRALIEKKGQSLTLGELMKRELANAGASQFFHACTNFNSSPESSLEELAELRRPTINAKMSGHKITYA